MLNTTEKTGKTTPGTSRYIELLNAFPPRLIASEADIIATQKVIDSLVERSESQDERDYLYILGMLVHEYEEIHEPLPDIHGVDLLKVLLQEFNLQEKDLLPIFETEAILSGVLNGQQELAIVHIQRLADFFHVSPAVFLPIGLTHFNEILSF